MRSVGPAPPPLLTIILPCYNHCQFITERLTSIYGQAISSFELIILDDASSDDSVVMMKRHLEGENYTLLVNNSNSGSPFSQWERGFMLSRGKYIWIAESDDSCRPAFVSSLLAALLSDDARIAFSRTLAIDEDGNNSSNCFWPDGLDKAFFASNQAVTCRAFLRNFQVARNCIPNVSSAIFQIDGFKNEAIEAARLASSYRYAGDWVFWNQLLKAYDSKRIFYHASPLCLHRNHSGTTRVELDRSSEKLRIREYSRAINNAMCILGLAAIPAFCNAISSRWWHWSYEQYLERYRPSRLERLRGSPQSGFHQVGYLFFCLRRLLWAIHH